MQTTGVGKWNDVRIPAALLMAAAAVFGSAAADDAPFLNTDPASVMAKGDHAIQQWLSFAQGHSGESYNAFESLTEYDYGLTDRIQLAATLAYDWDRTRPPGGPTATTSLVGVQAEAIFILVPTDKSPVGIALAVAPAWNTDSRGIAVRLLLTKYLWGFEHVLNINFENGWEKDGAGGWDESGALTLNYGLGLALDEHWTLALEAGNQFAFSRLVTSVNFDDAGTTVFLGPTVEYDCPLAVFTLGFQTQLPLASGGSVAGGYRTDAERWRAGFRVARSI
jgi:hypothetical protein